MMWKDHYRIGIDRIDEQHRELFRQAEELLQAIEHQAEPAQFQQAISFLKDYVVHHFQDEEAYQARIGYDGLEAHRLQHREFTDTVLAYENLLIQNQFDLPTVKRLAGTLSAWLIYHVADADQRIVNDRQRAVNQRSSGRLVLCCRESAMDVLEKLSGLTAQRVEFFVNEPVTQDGLLIRAGLKGDLKGNLFVGCTVAFACRLVELLTSVKHSEADELVCSAVSETAAIISENAVAALADRNVTCRVEAPELLLLPPSQRMEGALLSTKIGDLRLWLETV